MHLYPLNNEVLESKLVNVEFLFVYRFKQFFDLRGCPYMLLHVGSFVL